MTLKQLFIANLTNSHLYLEVLSCRKESPKNGVIKGAV